MLKDYYRNNIFAVY